MQPYTHLPDNAHAQNLPCLILFLRNFEFIFKN